MDIVGLCFVCFQWLQVCVNVFFVAFLRGRMVVVFSGYSCEFLIMRSLQSYKYFRQGFFSFGSISLVFVLIIFECSRVIFLLFGKRYRRVIVLVRKGKLGLGFIQWFFQQFFYRFRVFRFSYVSFIVFVFVLGVLMWLFLVDDNNKDQSCYLLSVYYGLGLGQELRFRCMFLVLRAFILCRVRVFFVFCLRLVRCLGYSMGLGGIC